MRLVLLVDGEHYPKAVRDAIATMEREGRHVVGAVFCGGTEKVDVSDLDAAYGVPVMFGRDLEQTVRAAIGDFAPEAVLDCTDEPVLGPADRFRLASVVLSLGLAYLGADFEFRPPVFADVLTKPAVTVFATGKRTGKTAVAGALARHAVTRGHTPAIVAVGRGGPAPPKVIEAGALLDPDALLALAASGAHASSDYVEDALTSGVATIGCMRVGGGLAGATVVSNMADGARLAESRTEDLVILEGSGASIPEVRADAGILVVPATLGPDAVAAYLNPYRLLLADLAVVTMAEEASVAAATIAAIHGPKGIRPGLDVVPVVFRPEPLADISGRKVYLCTTAPVSAGKVLGAHLEEKHGCDVVGMTHRLADREALRTELAQASGYDVLLVELKAAAVDVAIRWAKDRGTDVVFVNNTLVGTGVGAGFDRILSLASDRSSK